MLFIPARVVDGENPRCARAGAAVATWPKMVGQNPVLLLYSSLLKELQLLCETLKPVDPPITRREADLATIALVVPADSTCGYVDLTLELRTNYLPLALVGTCSNVTLMLVAPDKRKGAHPVILLASSRHKIDALFR